MDIHVIGDAGFHRFAVACEKASGPDFDKRMNHGLRLAGDDIGQAIVTASDIYMPSGYEALFRSRVRAKTEVEQGAAHKATVIVFAPGKTGRRDVQRLERGILRHPVYGRYRRLKNGTLYANPWTVTSIRRGFFSEPFRFAAPRAFKRINDALGGVLEEIGKAS